MPDRRAASPSGHGGGLPGGRDRRGDLAQHDAFLACPFLILAIALAAFLGDALDPRQR